MLVGRVVDADVGAAEGVVIGVGLVVDFVLRDGDDGFAGGGGYVAGGVGGDEGGGVEGHLARVGGGEGDGDGEGEGEGAGFHFGGDVWFGGWVGVCGCLVLRVFLNDDAVFLEFYSVSVRGLYIKYYFEDKSRKMRKEAFMPIHTTQ